VIEIDREILEQAKSGERMAQAKVFQYYKDYVFRTAFYMLRSQDEADDVVENVFLKVFLNFHTFDMTRSFHPWLSRIILNETRTYIKKYRRAFTNQEEAIHRMKGKSEASTETIHDMNQYMKELSLPDREILTLRYYQELTIEEIANTMKISISNTKVRIHRATKKLKKIIQQGEDINEVR
jgi:RNA polymerase sigma-70 factor (ECF subfamily)